MQVKCRTCERVLEVTSRIVQCACGKWVETMNYEPCGGTRASRIVPVSQARSGAVVLQVNDTVQLTNGTGSFVCVTVTCKEKLSTYALSTRPRLLDRTEEIAIELYRKIIRGKCPACGRKYVMTAHAERAQV